MTHQHHARAAVLGAAAGTAALLLTACGSANPPSGGDVTVTVTPTVTAQQPGSSTSQAPKVPKSDVVGRAFDFGVITAASKIGTTTVIELDRWTWKGLDDAKLAKNGVPTAPFKGAAPYENQNAKLTYTIPVADGARVLYNHCIAADQPLQTKSVDPSELKGLAEGENTVLVQLDRKGRAVAIQNIPGCPA